MGYTTEFDGHFTLAPALDAATLLRLQELGGANRDDFPRDIKQHMPDSYCQWQVTPDGQGLQWDGGEKFYNYVAWLQYLVDTVLSPTGITVSGAVHYFGEDPTDSGTLTVLHGQVCKQKNALVNADDLDELREFQAFALARDRDGKLAAAWQEHKRQQARG